MNNANELLQQAVARLEFVNEELNRPDEDVMALAMCHQTRTIIGDLLSAYLLMKGKSIEGARDLETLRTMSTELDEQFTWLDLSAMACHPGKLQGEECYCMDLNRVRSCLNIANELKGMVVRKFNAAMQVSSN